MKYCSKCKVSVRGNARLCPLCQTPLEEVKGGFNAYSSRTGPENEYWSESCYPEIPKFYSQYRHLIKVLIFATIIAGVASAAVNLILPGTGHWSLLVIVGIICFWISVFFAIRQRKSISKSITYQAFFMSLTSVAIDLLSDWHGWSLSYALPIIFVVAMLAMAILAVIMKLPANEYIICLIFDIIFGFIPIIFYLLGILTQNIPSIICIACSIICLAGIVLFQGREMLHELERRFHL